MLGIQNDWRFLVDSHCHLDYDPLSQDIKSYVEAAKDASVLFLHNISTSIANAKSTIQVAEDYPNIVCSVGLHPNNLKDEVAPTLDELTAMLKHEKVVSIGETGLDYYRSEELKQSQKHSLEIHIEAARISKLPLVIHCRAADSDMQDIIVSEMKNGEFGYILHCFNGSKELARTAMNTGGYISISGIITFKNTQELQALVQNFIPLSHMLIETDSPFLAPMPHRSKTNQPAYVKYVAEKIAELKSVPISEIASTTSQNFFKICSKARDFLPIPINNPSSL